jgi:NAD(P)-dependent dehydrogenase (short-subunit alcohol dehydrogenase family)
MLGKVVLITGSTDGIGKQSAIELAAKDATVIVHGRDKNKGLTVVDEIISKTKNNKIDFLLSDFSSLGQVRTLAEEIKSKYNKLDVLINNAGVFMKNRVLSKDGFEMTFAVNHLSYFLLTNLLLDLLIKSSPSRIINVASMVHQSADFDFDNLMGDKHYSGYNTYAISKLANIMFTYKLSEKLKGTGVTVNCLHPGGINTKLLHEGFGGGGRSVEVGAKIPVHLASSPKVENVTGKYFIKRLRDLRVHETPSSQISYDRNFQEKLWELSAKLTEMNE